MNVKETIVREHEQREGNRLEALKDDKQMRDAAAGYCKKALSRCAKQASWN
ncbi:hypothetical protein PAMC26510_23210 [Caballeronia sordidicola]|jgi:hypothetical protein|uniref:Uncharacterized protein n=1 Tax=Caballeronia sordidicola TaxID=196367 RepID=A0A242MJ48_CABSO|nr:hypothetical protein PAMC26510_23210 [Caballeronia sordidicola]